MAALGTAKPEAIGSTAHYTGYVWARNGLSHPQLATRRGRILYEALRPGMTASGLFGGPTLEAYLLARHRAIDALLERAIERDGVSQVIELACGLSPRGWRFASRYGAKLTYIEADLPEMAQHKRRALARIGSLGEHHRVEVVDALREQGAGSLAAVAERLDPQAGLAVITEGLLGYLEQADVKSMWERIAQRLVGFSAGLYLSDLHPGSTRDLRVRAFYAILEAFVRGRADMHFADSQDAELALRRAGFLSAAVRPAAGIVSPGGHPDAGARMAHVVEATTR